MLIALLTDFGLKDYFVGAMKGVIISINNNANIVDITHEVSPQDIHSAGFTLNACYKNFPLKTIFVAVVDPGVGSERRAILVETADYFFVAPDNGLLSFIFDGGENFKVYEITNEKYFHHPVSNSFHGRDIFSPAAAHLSNDILPNEFGEEIKDFVWQKTRKPERLSENEIEAEIIHIDHFGNLITNLKKDDLPKEFRLKINGNKIEKLREFFAEAKSDEVFMIFGSAGFLEVSVSQDSAEKILNAEVRQKVSVEF